MTKDPNLPYLIRILHIVVLSGQVSLGQMEPAISSPGAPGLRWLEVLGPNVGNPQTGLSSWLRDVVRGSDRWVAVGDNGAIYSSADGVSWNAACVSERDNLLAIAWTGSRYVAVGRAGKAFVSDDGMAWDKASTGVGANLNALIWAGDRLIAVGESGTVITSPDGTLWSKASLPPPSTVSGKCLAWNGSRLLLGGKGLYYSDDRGISWVASSTTPQSTIVDAAWSGSKWFAVGSGSYPRGYWLSSPDGKIWTETILSYEQWPTCVMADPSSILIGITASGGYGTDGDFIASEDEGATWRGLVFPFRYAPLAIARSGNIRLAVGKEGVAMLSSDGNSWESRLLAGSGHWLHSMGAVPYGSSRRSLPNSAYLLSSLMKDHSGDLKMPVASSSKLQGIAWNGSKYIAVGNDSVFTSVDGLSWEDHTPAIFQFVPTDICWTGDKWLIVASFGKVFTSTDGLTWSQGVLPLTYPTTVIADGPRIVVIGTSGGVASSTNGSSWQSDDLGIRDLNDIAWHDGCYIVVGDYGFAAKSTDGVCWTEIPSVTTNELSTVAWHTGRFVAVGSPYGRPVLSTTDGSSWTDTGARLGFSCQLLSLGQEVLAFSGPAEWAYSRDGLTWTQADVNGGNFGAVAWNGWTFVLFGNEGRVFLSSDGRTWWEQPRLPANAIPSDAIAYKDGFIAVDATGILRSSDSFDWERVFPAGSSGRYLTDIASSGSRWVAVGEGGTIITSIDTESWIPAASGTTSTLLDVIWAGDRFIACGSAGVVLSSRDGSNWTPVPSGRTDTIDKLVWNGTTLFMIAANRYVLSTDDFSTWNSADLGTGASKTVCIWVNNELVGMMTSGPQTYWISSPNGVTWKSQALGFWENYENLLWDGGQFLAVGWYQARRSGASDGGFNKWSACRAGQPVSFETINPASGLPFGIDYAMGLGSIDQMRGKVVLSLEADGTLCFATPMVAPSDVTYVIESSATLLPNSWLEVGTKQPGSSWRFENELLDYSIQNGREYFRVDGACWMHAKQFYRLNVHNK